LGLYKAGYSAWRLGVAASVHRWLGVGLFIEEFLIVSNGNSIFSVP